MLGIYCLYRYVNRRGRVGAQVYYIGVLSAHIALFKIAARTIGIGMRNKYLFTAGSRTDTQCISQVTRHGLHVRTVSPLDSQHTVFVDKGRLGGCSRSGVGYCLCVHSVDIGIFIGVGSAINTRHPDIYESIVI